MAIDAKDYVREFLLRLQTWIKESSYFEPLTKLISIKTYNTSGQINGYHYFSEVLKYILLPETYFYFTQQTPLALHIFLQKMEALPIYSSPDLILSLLAEYFPLLLEDNRVFEKISWNMTRFTQEYDKRFRQASTLTQIDSILLVEEVERFLQFNSPWDAASFLQKIGYTVHASYQMYILFHKFTGFPRLMDYEGWTEAFSCLSDNKEEQIWWDKVFCFLTEDKLQKRFPSLLCDGKTCSLCPFQKECYFFEKEFQGFVNEDFSDIEKSLLTSNFEKLTTGDLVKYSLPDMWIGNKKQYELIELFSFLNLSSLMAFRDQQDNELQKMYCRLLAIYELGNRFLNAEKKVKLPYLHSAKEIYDFILPKLKNKLQEEFHVLLFDGKQQLLWLQMISIGLLDRVLAHPREVLSIGLSLHASTFVVVHNHPSNVVSPSYADIQITERLKASGEIIGLTLLDHIIVGKDSQFYSFREQKSSNIRW